MLVYIGIVVLILISMILIGAISAHREEKKMGFKFMSSDQLYDYWDSQKERRGK